MKRLRVPLLLQVLLAIALGIGCSYIFPLPLSRAFVTFNDFFGEFLSFVIPLLILALVAPGIAELGAGAGKLLGTTVVIAYLSTVFAGYLAYFSGMAIFPSILSHGSSSGAELYDGSLKPFFHIDMPPVMDVMSALILAFVLGVGLSKVRGGRFIGVLKEFREVISMVIDRILIPLLPLFIFGIFLKMGVEKRLGDILGQFLLIIVIILALSIILLLIQFTAAGAYAGKNPIRSLVNMLPAYLTALGTQSSAATIPVTLRQARRNGVSDEVSDFVIPLCATVHLSGSCLKITACALAITLMFGMPSEPALFTEFILLLGVTMVAAPGVPGGAIMAALAVLESVLGFNEEIQGVMIALYIAMDSFGTACNVTGDGAIAMVIDKIHTSSRS